MDEQFEKSFKKAPAFVRWGAGIILLVAVIAAVVIAWDYAVPILLEFFVDILPA